MGESKYLNVLVGARVDGLVKGLKKGLKNVKAFGSKAGDLARKAGNAIAKGLAVGVAGLGAAMAGGLAGASIKLKEIGEQARMAADAGTSVEAFSRLGYAATASGVELDTVSEALKEYQMRLSEAINLDSGPGQEALKMLGIEAESLAGLDPSEAFARISGEMESLNNADKIFIADALFGGDANQMLSLLNKGEEGIRGLAAESDALGATLTTAEAQGAKQFNAAMNKMWATLDGVAMSISATLAPVMTSFVGIAQSGAEWIARKFEEWQGVMVRVLSTVEWAVTHWGDVWDIAVASVALSLVTWWEDMKHLFTETIPAVLGNAANYILGVFSNLGANIGEIMGEIWDYVTSMGDDPIELDLVALSDGIRIPDLPERERSRVEEALASDLARKVGMASKGIDELISERMLIAAGPKPVGETDGGGGAGKKKLLDPEAEEKEKRVGTDAVRAGSAAAVSAYITAVGGKSDEQQKMVRHLRKMEWLMQQEAKKKALAVGA